MGFDEGFRVDLLVEGRVVVELKFFEALVPVQGKQVLTYLWLMRRPVGLLINFGAATPKGGLHRIANHLPHSAPPREPASHPLVRLKSTRPSGIVRRKNMAIATKEARETHYWLRVLTRLRADAGNRRPRPRITSAVIRRDFIKTLAEACPFGMCVSASRGHLEECAPNAFYQKAAR